MPNHERHGIGAWPVDLYLDAVSKISFVRTLVLIKDLTKRGHIYTLIDDDSPKIDSNSPEIIRLAQLQKTLCQSLQTSHHFNGVSTITIGEFSKLRVELLDAGIKVFEPLSVDNYRVSMGYI